MKQPIEEVAERGTGPAYSIPHRLDDSYDGCDCLYMFGDGAGHLGAVCTFSVDDKGDGPTLEEAKADAILLRHSVSALLKVVEAWREFKAEMGGDSGVDTYITALNKFEAAIEAASEIDMPGEG